MENMVKNCSIIIPTYNRSGHLKKLLTYFKKNSLFLNFEIIVADSSNSFHKKKNLSLVQKYNNLIFLNFKNIQVSKKINLALKNIKTKYTVLCADDDFLKLESLQEATNFLSLNPNYIGATGKFINFQKDDSKIKIFNEYLFQNDFDNEFYLDRIKNFLENYQALFYCIFRTEHASKIFRESSHQDSLCFREIMQSVGILILGKIKNLDLVLGFRQSCLPADIKRKNWESGSWFKENPSVFIKKYIIYRKALSNLIKKEINTFTLKDLNKIDFYHFIFLAKNFYNIYPNKSTDTNKKNLHYFLKRLNQILIKKINHILLILSYKLLFSQKVYYSHKDFFYNFSIFNKDLKIIKKELLLYFENE